MKRRFWTDREQEIMRAEYGRTATSDLASKLRRTQRAVRLQALSLGLTKHYPGLTGEPYTSRLRFWHARGYSDSEIAAKLKTDRGYVGELRARLGLGCNRLSARCRAKVARKTRQQCRAAGVKTLADVRVLAFRKRAAAAGWPADLRPRAVQILNLLWDRGPMTRRELCDAMGMQWRGSRKSLCSNDPEGSYLAHLMARGLVVSLGRIVKGKGSGYSVHVYSLPLDIQRNPVQPEGS